MKRATVTALLLATFSVVCVHSASAADPEDRMPVARMAETREPVAKDLKQAQLLRLRYAEPSRPGLLLPLYASLASLQAYDVYSTTTALNLGGAEANPLMRGIVTNPALFVAVKAGVTGVSIFAAERLWRDRKRVGAVLLMVAANGAMAYVAHNNAAFLRTIR